MSITVSTTEPRELFDKITKFVKEGNSQTWEIDEDGDFTHSPEQWKNKAWLTVFMTDDSIIFGIWPPVGESISTEVYAVYHGRFAELLLAHFDEDFSEILVSSLPTDYDRIKSISL